MGNKTSFSRCLDVLLSSDDDESDSGAFPSSTKKGKSKSQTSIVPSQSSQSSKSSSSSFQLSRVHNKSSSNNNQSKKNSAPKKGSSTPTSTALRRQPRRNASLELELNSSSSSSSSEFSDLETKKRINRASPASRRQLRKKAQPVKQSIYSCSSASESSHSDSSQSESESNSDSSRDLRSKRARVRDSKISAKEAKARKPGTLVGSQKLRGIDPTLVDESSESEDYFQSPTACLTIQTRPIATKRNRSSKEGTATTKNNPKSSTADKATEAKPLASAVKRNAPPKPMQRKPPVQPPKKGSQQRSATATDSTDDDDISISSDESTNLKRMAHKCSIQKSLHKSPVYSPSNLLMYGNNKDVSRVKMGRNLPTSMSSNENKKKSNRSVFDFDDTLGNDDTDDTDNSSVETTELVERLKKRTQSQNKKSNPTNPRETRAGKSCSPQAKASNEANNDRGSLQRNDSYRNDRSDVDVESISSTGSSINDNNKVDSDVDIDSVDTAELNQRIRRNLGLATMPPASEETHSGPTPKKKANDQISDTDNCKSQENDKDEFILPACDSSSSGSSSSEGGHQTEGQKGADEKLETVPSAIQVPCVDQTNFGAVQSTEQRQARTTTQHSDRAAKSTVTARSQAASAAQNQSKVQHRPQVAAHASSRNVESSGSPSLGNVARPFNPYARSQAASGAQNQAKAQQQRDTVAVHSSSRNQEALSSPCLGDVARPFNPYSRARVDSNSGGIPTDRHSQFPSQNAAMYQTPKPGINPSVANPKNTSEQYQETEQDDILREVANQTEQYNNDDLEYLEDLHENGDSLPWNTARKASDGGVTRATNHQGYSRENIGREKTLEELEEEVFFSKNDTELRTTNAFAKNDINHAPDIVDLCDVVDDDEPNVPTHSTIVRQGLRVPAPTLEFNPMATKTAIDDIEYFSDDNYYSPQQPRRVTDVSNRGQILLATSTGGQLQPTVSSANYGPMTRTAAKVRKLHKIQ